MRTVIPTQQPRALTDTLKLLQNILSHAHIFPINPSPTPVHTRARARTIACYTFTATVWNILEASLVNEKCPKIKGTVRPCAMFTEHPTSLTPYPDGICQL